METSHELTQPHKIWPAGTKVQLRGSRKEDDLTRFPSGWSVLVRVKDRQGKGEPWPEFVLDFKQIKRSD